MLLYIQEINQFCDYKPQNFSLDYLVADKNENASGLDFGGVVSL